MCMMDVCVSDLCICKISNYLQRSTHHSRLLMHACMNTPKVKTSNRHKLTHFIESSEHNSITLLTVATRSLQLHHHNHSLYSLLLLPVHSV